MSIAHRQSPHQLTIDSKWYLLKLHINCSKEFIAPIKRTRAHKLILTARSVYNQFTMGGDFRRTLSITDVCSITIAMSQSPQSLVPSLTWLSIVMTHSESIRMAECVVPHPVLLETNSQTIEAYISRRSCSNGSIVSVDHLLVKAYFRQQIIISQAKWTCDLVKSPSYCQSSLILADGTYRHRTESHQLTFSGTWDGSRCLSSHLTMGNDTKYHPLEWQLEYLASSMLGWERWPLTCQSSGFSRTIYYP